MISIETGELQIRRFFKCHGVQTKLSMTDWTIGLNVCKSSFKSSGRGLDIEICSIFENQACVSLRALIWVIAYNSVIFGTSKIEVEGFQLLEKNCFPI